MFRSEHYRRAQALYDAVRDRLTKVGGGFVIDFDERDRDLLALAQFHATMATVPRDVAGE